MASETNATPGTTGHEWDGIEELNTPLPRWWVWTLWATVAWSIGYWILMPAWPTFWGYTKGMLGIASRGEVASELAAAKAARADVSERFLAASLEQILGDQDLLDFAMASGRAAFGDNCATCHGAGAQGSPGFPNLNDDSWLWGGRLEDIHYTISYGIRSTHDDTRSNAMPAFGRDEILDEAQIADLTQFVVSLSGAASDTEAAERGRPLFAENCAACHGEEGRGNSELGAPDLSDAIWLYGGEPEAIARSIHTGRGGVMPAWTTRLDPVTIKALAVYVHSRGGGQ